MKAIGILRERPRHQFSCGNLGGDVDITHPGTAVTVGLKFPAGHNPFGLLPTCVLYREDALSVRPPIAGSNIPTIPQAVALWRRTHPQQTRRFWARRSAPKA